MSIVNDPQIWTLLGVFAAIMLGGMTLMTTLLTRTLKTAIEGVDGRIDGVYGRIDGVDARIDGVNARIDGVNARVDGLSGELNARIDGLSGELNARIDGLSGEMNAKFETVNVKLAHLDRDVTAISKKVFDVPGA